MNHQHWIALPVTLFFLTPCASVLAQDEEFTYGWYEFGASFVGDATVVDFYSEPTSDNEVTFDPGFRFGIGFGAEVTRYLSFEFQSGFHYNAIESIDGASASSGNLYQVPLLANVVLHLPNKTRFVPYLGAGVGAYWTVLEAQNLSLGGTQLTGEEDTFVFGYQGFAGLRYQFNATLALGVSYHYGVAASPSWGSDTGNIKFSDLANQSAAITLHYRF